ncbi:MAG TPA: Zn-ribbon domain-containing OB-fold protein [Solirubrobacterales bacterium]|nr:Zn-ribbon domain-containing OB-fold protein [Solirubrobacterales bacterium]
MTTKQDSPQSTATEPWIVDQHWDITYQHVADPVAAQFLRTMRDEGKLTGIRCPKCERVLIPPRPFCDRCFVETEGWVDLPPEGVIELFTIVHLRVKGLPDPPYALVYVRPDGADTAIMNYFRGADLSNAAEPPAEVRIGERVGIKFADERTGRMTDFWYEPLG